MRRSALRATQRPRTFLPGASQNLSSLCLVISSGSALRLIPSNASREYSSAGGRCAWTRSNSATLDQPAAAEQAVEVAVKTKGEWMHFDPE